MIETTVCVAVNVACMPDGTPPQLPAIISQIPTGSDGFIRFYTNPWKRMTVSQKPGNRDRDCNWIRISVRPNESDISVKSSTTMTGSRNAARGFRFVHTWSRCKSGEHSRFVERSERHVLETLNVRYKITSKNKIIIIQIWLSNISNLIILFIILIITYQLYR